MIECVEAGVDLVSKLYTELNASNVSIKDADDFELLVASHFRKRVHHTRRTVLCFDNDKPAIEIAYSKAGKVLDVKNVSAPPKLVAQIREHLDADLFAPPRYQVSKSVVFYPVRIVGYHRRKDQWQLKELPSDAPRPETVLGLCPGLFEVRYRSSSDVWTNTVRLRRAEQEALMVLNSLLMFKLQLERDNGREAWVFGSTPNAPPELRQCGYSYDLGPRGAEFTSTQGLQAIPQQPSEEYYSQPFLGIEDPLTVPDDLDEMLDYFDGLPAETREQYVRASYWASQSRYLAPHSQSAAMIAAISAVEALAAPKELRTSATGEVRDAVKAFHDVIEATLGREYVKQHTLYDIRSDLAHGSRVLLYDEGGMPSAGERARVEEDAGRFIRQALPMVMHRWLVPEARQRISAATNQLPWTARLALRARKFARRWQ